MLEGNLLMPGVILKVYDEQDGLLWDSAPYDPLNQELPAAEKQDGRSPLLSFFHWLNTDEHYTSEHVFWTDNRVYRLEFIRKTLVEAHFLSVLTRNLVAANILGLGVAVVSGVFISRKILRPVRQIIDTTKNIKINNLEERLDENNCEDELQELARTINRMLHRIQTGVEQQQRFVADASHELRTPLAVIQTNLEIVRGNTDESVAAQHNWLNNIQEEVGYMTKLVDSLLFLARVDARQIPCENARFPLETAVRHTVMPFEPLAETKNIALTMQTEPLTYYGDEAKIKQLLGILLDNALRYTPAGGNVTVHLYKSPQAVHIDVADTGPGIAAEYLEKIFDRFFQVDPSRSKELGGTGLGLAIAKCLAACQRARIKVKSRPGEGSVFSVRLPLESTSGQPSGS
ncbi:MAG TPA: two-component sensor histidine kinase [Firmicutes bacterium]|nr:two-component sensor histidine kinase [Bacillota bacterium]